MIASPLRQSTRRPFVLSAGLALLALTVADAPAMALGARQNRNERIVRAFYEAGLNRKDFAAASVYLGHEYVQHDPMAADGASGLAQFIEYLRQNYPQAHSEIRKSFSDGDFVILHVREKLRPDDRGNAIVDIFRLKGGKIVEHWDVKQAIPDRPANNNGMF